MLDGDFRDFTSLGEIARHCPRVCCMSATIQPDLLSDLAGKFGRDGFSSSIAMSPQRSTLSLRLRLTQDTKSFITADLCRSHKESALLFFVCSKIMFRMSPATCSQHFVTGASSSAHPARPQILLLLTVQTRPSWYVRQYWLLESRFRRCQGFISLIVHMVQRCSCRAQDAGVGMREKHASRPWLPPDSSWRPSKAPIWSMCPGWQPFA